jgi:sialic acid synthase SpsE
LAATSLGAEILEFHAVFDRRMFGPDAKASLEINEIKTLVKGVHQIRESLQTQVEKNDIEKYKELKINVRQITLCKQKYSSWRDDKNPRFGIKKTSQQRDSCF